MIQMENELFEALLYAGHIVDELSRVKFSKEELNNIIDEWEFEFSKEQKEIIFEEFGFSL